MRGGVDGRGSGWKGEWMGGGVDERGSGWKGNGGKGEWLRGRLSGW